MHAHERREYCILNQNSGRKNLVHHSNVVIQENVVKYLFPKIEGKEKLQVTSIVSRAILLEIYERPYWVEGFCEIRKTSNFSKYQTVEYDI